MTDAAQQAQSANNCRKLLQKWAEKCKVLRDGHYVEAARLQGLHYRLGFPAVAMSTLVGTAVFADLQNAGGLAGRLAVGAASVLAAVLAGLVTFMRYTERAQEHRKTAYAFEAVVREIEAVLAYAGAFDPRGTVRQIRERLDALEGGPALKPNRLLEPSSLSTASSPSREPWEEIAEADAQFHESSAS